MPTRTMDETLTTNNAPTVNPNGYPLWTKEQLRIVVTAESLAEALQKTGRTKAAIDLIRVQFRHMLRGEIPNVSQMQKDAFKEFLDEKVVMFDWRKNKTDSSLYKKPLSPHLSPGSDIPEDQRDPFTDLAILMYDFQKRVEDIVLRAVQQIAQEKVRAGLKKAMEEVSSEDIFHSPRKLRRHIKKLTVTQGGNP